MMAQLADLLAQIDIVAFSIGLFAYLLWRGVRALVHHSPLPDHVAPYCCLAVDGVVIIVAGALHIAHIEAILFALEHCLTGGDHWQRLRDTARTLPNKPHDPR